MLLQAKDMVGLVNKFAAKIEEKKGTVTEDEVGCICTSQPYLGTLSSVALKVPWGFVHRQWSENQKKNSLVGRHACSANSSLRAHIHARVVCIRESV